MKRFLVVLAALALAACGSEKSNDPKPRVLAIEVDDAISATAAAGVVDPWLAREALANKIAAVESQRCAELDPSGHSTCVLPPNLKQKVEAQLNRYESEAVGKGSAAAIVYAHKNGRSDVASVFAAADRAAGVAKDGPLLRYAGTLAGGGQAVIRDTSRAVGYLARAWAAGEAQAANDAAVYFLAINDRRNAYLWSLRCVAGCARNPEVGLDLLQQSLKAEAAKQAQLAASDETVVELDTGS